jgi:hypothetical protein
MVLPMARGPYNNLPPHRFWRAAVSSVPPFAVDPIVATPFTIGAADRVASAGSCFAQHVAKRLQASGYVYYVPESAPPGLSASEAAQRNFSVFSCRYGNIYTTAQLRQTFDRAFGRLTPQIDVWTRSDGRIVDPYRPLIEPDGYDTIEAMHAARDEHLRHVREMFEQLDVFVFTLGQTEHWRARGDGVVVPVAPGVSGGTFDESVYEFHNARATEALDDMLAFIDSLRAVNPKSRVILSVSPVSLLATYEDRHALVANCYTKSALRVVAEEVCRARPDIAYFPSYEIITAPFNAARAFAEDQREVTDVGVEMAMKTFFAHFTQGGGKRSARFKSATFDAASEFASASKIVCDEVAIEGP